MLLLLLSFVAGVLTVLAPCVLPLLPIIIGGSVAGGTSDKYVRPTLIALSLAVSLFLFTVLLKATTALVDVSPKVWLYTSGGIVIALGVTSLFPATWDAVASRLKLSQNSHGALERSSSSRRRFVGPVLVGAALGPVFSSCSPTYAFILATVLPRDFTKGLTDLLSYCLGLVAILLVVSVYGRAATQKVKWMANPQGAFRRILGVIFVVVGLSIVTGYNVTAQTWVADHLPFDVTNVDKSLLGSVVGKNSTSKAPTASQDMGRPDLFNVAPYQVPQLRGLTNWINSSPETLPQLHGKVVLVDFWTYSCINCVRSIPHVEQWYERYKAEGFTVVGVHSPEFSFEHDPKNVADAVKRFGITYPVALDNNRDTWNAFDNDYWPADYLIDQNGTVRRVDFGEGNYDNIENTIKFLLGDKTKGLSTPSNDAMASSDVTPETYFGNLRAERYEMTPHLSDGEATFTPAARLDTDDWALSGDWDVDQQQVTSRSSNSRLIFNVQAENVYVVVGSAEPAQVGISIDGTDEPPLAIDGPRLYQVAQFDDVRNATITLEVPPGVSLNTFTFG
jgi:cytochrome c biogenesis protein CcdA/thiol-disulfide isomerase/thioredoxin